MKLLISLMLLVTLCSCGGSTNPKKNAKAEELCKNNGGLHRLSIYIIGPDEVYCMNGARFRVSINGLVYDDFTRPANKPQISDSDIRRREDMKNIDYDIKRVEEEAKMLDAHMKRTLKEP